MATKKKSSTAKKNTEKSTKKSSSTSVKSKSPAASAKASAAINSNASAKGIERKVETTGARASEAVSSVKITKGSSSLSKKELALKKSNAWNWMFALLFAAQAGALVYFADAAYRGITISYLTEDVIAGQNYAVYAQAVRHLMDLNVSYLLAAILGVNALMYLLVSSLLRKKYESDLDRERNVLRWIGPGVGSALMAGTTALLAGVSDVSLLLLIGASVGFAVSNTSVDHGDEYCGFMGYVKKSTLLQTLNTLAWLMPWVAIGLYLVGSEKYGSGVPVYIYALAATAFFGTALQMMYINRKAQKRAAGVDYANVDWTHSVLGLVVSAAFVWQIFFAIMA